MTKAVKRFDSEVSINWNGTNDCGGVDGVYDIDIPLRNGDSINFQLTDADMAGLIRIFGGILYEKALALEEGRQPNFNYNKTNKENLR